jgi:hypothetical protein
MYVHTYIHTYRYFGCRNNATGGFCPDKFRLSAALPQVKMIEIKLSQGAKPSHGGILPKSKISAAIAEARGIPRDQDCNSPPNHQVIYICIPILCVYVCILYVCIYVRTYVCMYVRMYVCTYVCTYVCVYVCMCVCIYICVYRSFRRQRVYCSS